jgi:hypothetical protein
MIKKAEKEFGDAGVKDYAKCMSNKMRCFYAIGQRIGLRGTLACTSLRKWPINEKPASNRIIDRRMYMKSTFHELQLGQVVIQNTTPTGTEQLIVRLQPESASSVQIEIKQNTNDSKSVSSSISITPHDLQKLFGWLREEGVLS